MSRNSRKMTSFQTFSNPDYSGLQELLDSEYGLVNYSRTLVHKLHDKLNLEDFDKRNVLKLLEFGAGTGSLADIFKSEFGISPECIELDPKLLRVLLNKGYQAHQFLDEATQDYSSIYCSNVLEHIENDFEVLSKFYNCLILEGAIAIYVPAFPILFAEMDKQVGHVRRYTKKELKQKIKDAGFEVQSVEYNDTLGFIAALVVKVVGYRHFQTIGTAKSFKIYDKIIYPVSKMLDAIGFRFLFGKNLLVVAKKSQLQ